MLNLTVAMLKAMLTVLILFQELTIAITSPQTGETLRGQVEILGRMDTPDFASAELSFSYAASTPAEGWFVIQAFPQPTADSVITVWDTTALTDGDYNLRLRVYSQDGSFQEAIVTDLKIRNYTSDPTATPAEGTALPTLPSFSQFSASPASPSLNEPTPTIAYPTSTPLPPNPASLTVNAILSIFGKSALVILGLFIFISLLLRLRRN
jgi:hypothetical protein